MVIVVELLNSAIEILVERLWPEQNALAGRAKDICSAAVFSSILLSIAVWLLVLVTP